MRTSLLLVSSSLFALSSQANALQPRLQPSSLLPSASAQQDVVSRRSVLFVPATAAAAMISTVVFPTASFAASGSNGLSLTTAPSGLKWAEAKVGTGQPIKAGAVASIDYSMASTAGRFPQIYTTKDKGTPYRWTLGDGSTIAGIEKAIIGDENDGIPPMLPGGIRRVIVPSNFGYEAMVAPNAKCTEGGKNSVGPIPPKDDSGAYQRWAQFYCNPRIPYQVSLQDIDLSSYHYNLAAWTGPDRI